MSIYSFKTNKAAETEKGIVLDYGAEKIRVLRAGRSNRKYSELLSKRMRPHQRQISDNTLDPDTAEKIMTEVYADSIIIGWEGVCYPNGDPMPYTRDNVIRLLLDLPDLFADIQEQAQKLSNFREEEIEADRKN